MCILLSKEKLCRIFGLYSQASGRCYYGALRKKVLTDDVLARVGMDPRKYKTVKTFDAKTSKAIIEVLKIEKHEIQDY